MDAWLGKHTEKQRYRAMQALSTATIDEIATKKMPYIEEGANQELFWLMRSRQHPPTPEPSELSPASRLPSQSICTIRSRLPISRDLSPCLPATNNHMPTTSESIRFHTAPGSLVPHSHNYP
jgi:hypothetical protein